MIFTYNNLTESKQMTDVKLLVLHRDTWNDLFVLKQMINSE